MLISPEMRHAAKDIKQYVSDYNFLTDNQIHTTDDLTATIEETHFKIAELEEKRSKADNKKRRAITPEDKERYKALRKEITQEITPLRKKLKQAEGILDKSPHLYELLQKPMIKMPAEKIQKIAPKIKEKDLEDFILKSCEYYYRHLMRSRDRDAR